MSIGLNIWKKNSHILAASKGLKPLPHLFALLAVQAHIQNEQKLFVVLSGLSGIIIYLLIDGITAWLEQKEEESTKQLGATVKGAGFVGFYILELIDASFSLDGVLGAFALSKDILIITIGLAIGAMFVSL